MVNQRRRRALECAPTDRIGADLAAMLALPPVAPPGGARRCGSRGTTTCAWTATTTPSTRRRSVDASRWSPIWTGSRCSRPRPVLGPRVHVGSHHRGHHLQGSTHGDGQQPFPDIGGDLAHRHAHHIRHPTVGGSAVVLVPAVFFW